MGFRADDKRLVGTFFVGHRKAIRQMITNYANSHNNLPSINHFIRMLAEYIDLLPSDKFADIKAVMTPDNMQDDQELMQAKFNEVAKGIKIPQPPSPLPAPTPASSSSEPEFAGAYFADDGMGDSKGRLIREQGMDAADASLAVNTTDISGRLRGATSQGLYLHKTVKSSGGLGVKDKQYGGNKVTFIYQERIRGFYLVGFAEHRKVKKGRASTYYVTRSFITALKKGDTLTFR